MKKIVPYIVAAVALAVVLYLTRPGRIIDLRSILPKGLGEYRRRDLKEIKRLVIHHTGSNSDTIRSVARYHTSKGNHICQNGCPAISYHYMIDSMGRIYQTNDIQEVSYHVGGNNSASIGVAFLGDFNTRDLSYDQVKALKRLYRILSMKIAGLDLALHRDFSSTSCPGSRISLDLFR